MSVSLLLRTEIYGQIHRFVFGQSVKNVCKHIAKTSKNEQKLLKDRGYLKMAT